METCVCRSCEKRDRSKKIVTWSHDSSITDAPEIGESVPPLYSQASVNEQVCDVHIQDMGDVSASPLATISIDHERGKEKVVPGTVIMLEQDRVKENDVLGTPMYPYMGLMRLPLPNSLIQFQMNNKSL